VIDSRIGLRFAEEYAERRARRPVADIARLGCGGWILVCHLERHIEVDLFAPEAGPGLDRQSLPEGLPDAGISLVKLCLVLSPLPMTSISMVLINLPSFRW